MPCRECNQSGHNIRTCHIYALKKREKQINKTQKPFCGFKKHPKSDNPCVICLENIGKYKSTLKCGHEFCTECLIQHAVLNNKCPMCRTSIIDEQEPTFDSVKNILFLACDNYIVQSLNNQGISSNWQEEYSGIVLDLMLLEFQQKNMHTPALYNDDGSYADWLILFINNAIETYYNLIKSRIFEKLNSIKNSNEESDEESDEESLNETQISISESPSNEEMWNSLNGMENQEDDNILNIPRNLNEIFNNSFVE